MLLPDLQQRLRADKGEVLPVVIGTRGLVPKETLLALEKVNIVDMSRLSKISTMTLRMSVEI
jgi:hypothetical protein